MEVEMVVVAGGGGRDFRALSWAFNGCKLPGHGRACAGCVSLMRLVSLCVMLMMGGRGGDCREGLTPRQSHFGQTNPPVSATAASSAFIVTADHSGCRDIWKA